jgi:diguanylate cyclase (GGDEF)-like protein
LYKVLAHVFPKRFGHKVFFAAFVGTHIPLISFTVYVLQSSDNVMRYASDFWLILVATLIGTVLTLAAMHALLIPLYQINKAMHHYETHGEIHRLPDQFSDELGDVMKQVNRLVFHVDSSMNQLNEQAMTDPLTGLLNRKGLIDRIGDRTGGALLVLDLNRFKAINDNYGHQAGDQVLQEVANCLKARVRVAGSMDTDDLVARWGGDEFIIVLRNASVMTARNKANDIERAIERHFAHSTFEPKPSVSIGIQMLAGLHFTKALEKADSAMYANKERREHTIGCEGIPA